MAFVGFIKAGSAPWECVTVNWSLGSTTGDETARKRAQSAVWEANIYDPLQPQHWGISRHGRHLSSKHQRAFDEDGMWLWTAVMVPSSRGTLAEVEIPSNSSDPGSLLNVCFHLIFLPPQTERPSWRSEPDPAAGLGDVPDPLPGKQSWTQQLPCECISPLLLCWLIVGIWTVNLGSARTPSAHVNAKRERKDVFNLCFSSYTLVCRKEQNSAEGFFRNLPGTCLMFFMLGGRASYPNMSRNTSSNWSKRASLHLSGTDCCSASDQSPNRKELPPQAGWALP